MGAGKTTLVKGVAQSLGVKHPITSPTFLMLKHYEGKDGMTFVHIDGYRLKHSVDSTTVGIHEYLGKPDTVCVIEWPKRIMLPKRLKNIRTISMHHGNNQTRRITY